jgi:hypothetical protein
MRATLLKNKVLDNSDEIFYFLESAGMLFVCLYNPFNVPHKYGEENF